MDPAAAVENLKYLCDSNFDGPMGLYESIDFNSENNKDGERGVVIYAYMAHHQGMSLTALDNVLHHDVMVRRLHSDVRVRAVESLLFERIPVTRPPAEPVETRSAPPHTTADEEPADRVWREDTVTPLVHSQGNGRYSLMVTNSGGSHSRWNEFDLTRWRSHTSLDRWGSFIYIRDLRSNSVWSAALQPLGGAADKTIVCFSADRAEFTRRFFGIETVLDVAVAVDDDAELRRLSITNLSLRTRQLEFTSYLELALAPHRTDSSHPAFAKMFVQTECPESGVLVAWRRPGLPTTRRSWPRMYSPAQQVRSSMKRTAPGFWAVPTMHRHRRRCGANSPLPLARFSILSSVCDAAQRCSHGSALSLPLSHWRRVPARRC